MVGQRFAGDAGDAVRQTGAKADELRDAARFLVQQLCFARVPAITGCWDLSPTRRSNKSRNTTGC